MPNMPAQREADPITRISLETLTPNETPGTNLDLADVSIGSVKEFAPDQYLDSKLTLAPALGAASVATMFDQLATLYGLKTEPSDAETGLDDRSTRDGEAEPDTSPYKEIDMSPEDLKRNADQEAYARWIDAERSVREDTARLRAGLEQSLEEHLQTLNADISKPMPLGEVERLRAELEEAVALGPVRFHIYYGPDGRRQRQDYRVTVDEYGVWGMFGGVIDEPPKDIASPEVPIADRFIEPGRHLIHINPAGPGMASGSVLQTKVEAIAAAPTDTVEPPEQEEPQDELSKPV